MSSLGTILLLCIIVLMPVVGFILTLGHARKGDTVRDRRWRKSHGMIFWVILPTIAGTMTLLGVNGILPSIYSAVGVIILALSTSTSLWLQRKHEG